MKNIEMTRVTSPKSEMNKMSSLQAKRFVMFTFIMRDLSLLQKILLYISNEDPKTEPEKASKNTAIFFFLKTLASKIHEAWVFLHKNNILDEIKNLSGHSINLKTQSKAVDDFYSEKPKEMFDFVRNKFGFHYEYQNDIDESIIDALGQLDGYEAWLSKDSTNEIFNSSDEAALRVIFSKMQQLGYQGNDGVLLDIFFDLVVRGARIFQDFSYVYITEGLSLSWSIKEKVQISVPELSNTSLSLIVSG